MKNIACQVVISRRDRFKDAASLPVSYAMTPERAKRTQEICRKNISCSQSGSPHWTKVTGAKTWRKQHDIKWSCAAGQGQTLWLVAQTLLCSLYNIRFTKTIGLHCALYTILCFGCSVLVCSRLFDHTWRLACEKIFWGTQMFKQFIDLQKLFIPFSIFTLCLSVSFRNHWPQETLEPCQLWMVMCLLHSGFCRS